MRRFHELNGQLRERKKKLDCARVLFFPRSLGVLLRDFWGFHPGVITLSVDGRGCKIIRADSEVANLRDGWISTECGVENFRRLILNRKSKRERAVS